MKRYLWVVEILSDNGKQWTPTVGAYLSKSVARREMIIDWQYANPDDKFRIVKYVRQDD